MLRSEYVFFDFTMLPYPGHAIEFQRLSARYCEAEEPQCVLSVVVLGGNCLIKN